MSEKPLRRPDSAAHEMAAEWRDKYLVAGQEIERLRAALMEAAIDLNSIMERRNSELVGSVWGDVDNVRLDCLLAERKAKGER